MLQDLINKNGFIHKLKYGSKSKVIFNLKNYKIDKIGNYILYRPIECKIMTLNDIPINFIISHKKLVDDLQNKIYNLTYYIQYNIDTKLTFII